MKVSVIIPVYNAESFIEKAVFSALQQKETCEVLLIEDGSSDRSLDACMKLADKHEKVKLYRHKNGENRGAAESRNLGIIKSQCDLIAFLDADDYYLPGRFSQAKQIMENDVSVDGVYEAIGMHFYDSNAKALWLQKGGELLTTLNKTIEPENLFPALIEGDVGYLHLDGLVVNKKLFNYCGVFPANLRLHQDTALILKLSLFGKLVPGRLGTPVALRGIHKDNRITKNDKAAYTNLLLWSSMFEWSRNKRISINNTALLYKKLIESNYYYEKSIDSGFSKKSLKPILSLLCIKFVNHPALFCISAFHRLLSFIKA